MRYEDLAGRTALVSGSGRGLGRAMALGLIGAGVRVAIVDIDAEPVEEALSAARGIGGRDAAIGIVADLSDPGEAARAVETARARLGGIAILVNNAGIGPEAVRRDFMARPIKIWEIPIEAWRRVFGINSDAPFFLTRLCVPAMIDSGWGRIVNVTTSLDTMIRGGYAPYGGSKAANEAHLAMLAEDLGGSGVTANVLVPGGPANTRLIPFDAPIARESLVQPEAMVPPLLWLASRQADDFTGRRLAAVLWDPGLPPAAAAERAGAPLAWPQLGRQSQHPAGWPDGKK
jgi:NAD(P)-dependent dehydrogenase (short-subunit alcohol dehydrogenase family)